MAEYSDEPKLLGQTEAILIRDISNEKFDGTRIKHEPIIVVPSSFLLHNVLSSEECGIILDQVF
jgi:hypothetical protein